MPEAMRMIIALMTKRNSPKVTTVTGSVTTISMGLTRLSSSDITIAVMSTAQNDVTSTPGSSHAPTITAMESTSKRVRQPPCPL